MIRSIVSSSLSYRLLVLVVAALVVFLGVRQIEGVALDILPEFKPPTVEVRTEALGLSAAEVEEIITTPIEKDLLPGMPWLDTYYSESLPGLSRIVLVFEPGTDPMHARQLVQERLTAAFGLPNAADRRPEMLQPLSSTNRVLMVRLSSRELSPIEMSVLARWTIRPHVLAVPGVANVSIWGQRERQLQVRVDPETLHQHGVTLQQVIETTGNALWVSPLTFVEASTHGSGGFIDTRQQRLGIYHRSPIRTADDLAQVILEGEQGQIPAAGGQPLRLGDVAQVVEDHQLLIGDRVAEEGLAGLILMIEKLPEASTLEVTRGWSRRWPSCSQGCPASRSTRPSSAPPPTSSCRLPTSTARCC